MMHKKSNSFDRSLQQKSNLAKWYFQRTARRELNPQRWYKHRNKNFYNVWLQIKVTRATPRRSYALLEDHHSKSHAWTQYTLIRLF